jgi:hypothetical protein
MSLFPALLDDDTGMSRRQVEKARRAQTEQTLEVFRYGLGAHARAQIDQHDSQAIGDASQAALNAEMDLLDYGLSRAGTSAAKVELVSRHVQRMATINDRRIIRRFGG